MRNFARKLVSYYRPQEIDGELYALFAVYSRSKPDISAAVITTTRQGEGA